MSQYINKYYNASGSKQKLVIFLHGYNGSTVDITPQAEQLASLCQNALIVTPESDEICEKNPLKKQWYSLWQFDPQDERRQPQTSLAKLIEIYNRYGDKLKEKSYRINKLIDELQQKNQLQDKQTIIIGFSQGAMLTCYTALTRQQPIAAAIMLSGVAAGSDNLANNILSHPPFYLFHGQQDITVNYKTLEFTQHWLKEHKITVQTQTYPDLAHKISPDEIRAIADIINKL